MWPWSSGGADKPPAPKPSPAETNKSPEPSKATDKFDPDRLPEREKLPAKLQKIVDKEDENDFLDDLYEG